MYVFDPYRIFIGRVVFLSGCGFKYYDVAREAPLHDAIASVKTQEEKQELLAWSASMGRGDIIKELLEDKDVDLNYDPHHAFIQPPFYPALCAAVAADQLEIVKLLLQKGAHVNQKCADNRSYPVGLAARYENRRSC